MCLVRPEHIINGVPHEANCVFEPFITAATGLGLPQFSPYFYRPPLLPYAVTSAQLPPSRRHPPDNGWNIVDEVGDGACLLRTIARRVFGNPELHPKVEAKSFCTLHKTLNNTSCIYATGSRTNQSTSLGAPHALTTTCKTTSKLCHTQTLTPATSKLLLQYNIQHCHKHCILGVVPLPSFPINPSHLNILYQPNFMHYSTLLPLNNDIKR